MLTKQNIPKGNDTKIFLMLLMNFSFPILFIWGWAEKLRQH